MAGSGDGTGRLIKHLGSLGSQLVSLSGTVGGPQQPSTLLVRFILDTETDLLLTADRSQPRLSRFVSITLQGADNRLFDSEGPGAIRLSAGSYDIAITSLDWRASPWGFSLQARALGTLRVSMSVTPGLRVYLGIKRLQGRLTCRPGLRSTLGRTIRLACRSSLRPGMKAGLISIPNYEPPSTDLLSHAWVVQDATTALVGCANGLVWDTLAGLPTEPSGYVPTVLVPADYTAGSSRLIFSLESPAYYGANPGIGPVPTDVTAPASPDYPSLSFLELTSGAYRRDIMFSLPAGNDRQILVQMREVLRWGNDIVRDLPPPGARFTAENRLARSATDRRYAAWLVSRTSVKPLQVVPLTLIARFTALVPRLSDSLVTLSLRVPGSGAVRPRVPCLVPSFIADEELPGEGDALFLSPAGAPFRGLLLSYGLTRSLQANRDFFSPAIFDTLAGGPAVFGLPGYDPQDYDFVEAQLPSLPLGLRQYSPWFIGAAWAEDGTSDAIYQNNAGSPLSYARWDGAPPTDAGVQVDPLSTSWTRIDSGLTLDGARLNRASDPRALVATDWGESTACRIRLLELGFDSTDFETGESGDPRFLPLAARLKVQPGLRGSLFAQGIRALQGRVSATPGLFRSALYSGP
jgi:hypothetical protein